jgi:hypothetical protein
MDAKTLGYLSGYLYKSAHDSSKTADQPKGVVYDNHPDAGPWGTREPAENIM